MIVIVNVFSMFLVTFCIAWFLKSDPPPKCGVYSQPNKWYWLKYAVFRTILWVRKRQQNRAVTGDNAGMGRKSRNSPDEMDKQQSLPKEYKKAVDAVYLTGSNKDGQFLVCATARRHDNHVQTVLFLRVPEIGFLQLPCIPDTSLTGTLPGEFAAGGLHITMVEPMKKWNIKFNGKLRLVSTNKLFTVKFSLDWVACTKYFDFDIDLHPAVLCDAIAREKWSRAFFNTLQSIHQTHYEQFGDTTGTVNIEGHEPVYFNIRGVRDHSYGNIRDWSQLHRYCIQYCSLSDGTNLCVSAISMPATTSRLHCGFIFHPSGVMEPLSWCDLEFEDIGDDGTPVDKFTIRFTAGGCTHTLEVEVLDRTMFYIGEGHDAKIHERYCRYHMDGVEGYGLSEWEYRNTDETVPLNDRSVSYLATL